MTYLIEKLAVGVCGVGLLAGLCLVGNLKGITPAIPYQDEIKIEQPEIFIPLITKEQELWLKKLRNCESGNNPLARNDHDRDNLPAKGLYQFKDKT